jgi:hypothetical protein
VDFNRALKDHAHDSRGLFPLNEHPTAASHELMAEELARVAAPLFGLKPSLSLAIQDMGWIVVPGQPLTFSAALSSDSQAGIVADASLELSLPGSKPEKEQVAAAAGKTARLQLTAKCPPLGSRSQQYRLWAYASGARAFAFAQKWVTFAPLLPCPPATEPANPPPPGIQLGEASVVLGREQWEGKDDLSADVWLSRTETDLRVQVRVHDDQLVRDFHRDPFENDCVELYFDLRPEREQGRLFYGARTFGVFVKPPTPAFPDPETVPLSPLPQEAKALWCLGQLELDGYSVEVHVPLTAFRANGKQLPRFGFDLAVDDADEPGWRQTELLWAGQPDDAVNPSSFGVVQLDGDVPRGAHRVTVR